MTDETPIEPSPELEAEVDGALANAYFPDGEAAHMAELVLIGMRALGADALFDHWTEALPDMPEAFDDAFYDRLRDWNVSAGEALQEFVKVHGLTKLRLPLCHLSCGHVRSLDLAVGS